MRKILLLTLLTLTIHATAQDIHSGDALIRAMYNRYKDTWYRTLTFTQKSTTYKPDGTISAETWYEALSIPAKLRIDIGPLANGNGYVMVDGHVTIVKDHKITATQPLVNMLLVLGFDVYRQDADTTAKVIKDEGYDLTKVHEDTWDGKAAYVVGADKGDLKSKQFWVEKETLLFVRDIEPARGDPGKMDDIRFIHYGPMAGAWVAAGVEVYTEGKKVFSEDYTDIQANAKLDPAIWDAKQFDTTHWEK
jgi:hypothetical protein